MAAHKEYKKWWDKERIKKLRKLWKSGKSDEYIADKLGVTVSSVRSARQRNGFTQNTPSALSDTEKQAIRDLALDHTRAEIAAILERSKSTIDYYIRHNGITVKQRTPPKKPINKSTDIYCEGPIREYTYNTDVLIMQFLSEGYSLMHIAAILQRDYEDLQQYCDNNYKKLYKAHKRMMKHEGVYAACLGKYPEYKENVYMYFKVKLDCNAESVTNF